MSLAPGNKLGAYEILSPLGAGGMGEVYRARDTKLGRDVAIKILPAEVADDDERLARFKREAQVLASLNHPHIAAIHGLEQDGDRPFLVLELVKGETLAERMSRGPLSVEEAVALAHQVAEALEHAHEKGIVHRDLKPANIMITPAGNVKVLDFGLAKAFAGDGAEGKSAELSQSPTLSRHTAAGVILGTAAYMSPEQARGKTVDKRADIWAFGVVLFEMLTGRDLFTGETVSDVLAAVLRAEVDWAQLPAETPPGLRRLLRRTLTREPSERLHDIADARLELRDVREEDVAPTTATASVPARSSRRVIAAIALGAVIVGGIVAWTARPGPSRAARFALPVPAPLQGHTITGSWIAVSPDGSRLAFASEEALHVRRLDELDFWRIEGTDGARGPFFSPDGEWIRFFADEKLKKVSLANEAVLTVCDAPQGRGGAWREDGTIFFAPDALGTGIFSVPASGGVPRELTTPDLERGEKGHRWPSLLPDGQHAFMTVLLADAERGERAAVALVSLDTGEWEHLVESALDGRYLPTGHIVFAREGVMLAAPFDRGRMEISGVETPVLTDLTFPPAVPSMQIPYALSEDGVLAYVPMPFRESRLELVDLDGNRTPAARDALHYRWVRFSPDVRRAAVGVRAGEDRETWLLDVERQILSRMSSVGGSQPVWSPDGSRLAVVDRLQIVVHSLEGDATPETWVTHSSNLSLGCWTPDGRALLYAKRDSQNFHITMKPEDGEEQILLGDPFRQANPRLSPDGRWLAYSSNENGRFEIFVRAFPSMDGKQQVSTSGGVQPVWSPDGTSLYYLSEDALMSAAMTSSGDGLIVGPTRSLFEVGLVARHIFAGSYDIAPDGKTFLFVTGTDSKPPEIRVVLNGFDELTGGQ